MVLGVETSVSVRTCAANHMKSHVKYDLRKFGFTDRVVNTWNSLPNWLCLLILLTRSKQD